MRKSEKSAASSMSVQSLQLSKPSPEKASSKKRSLPSSGKSVNRRWKGRRKELKVRDILEAAGYDVQLAPLPTRWARQNDLFGLWDVMAVNTTTIRFIQVKSRKPGPEYIEQLQMWQCPPNCTKELWVLEDRVKEPIITIL